MDLVLTLGAGPRSAMEAALQVEAGRNPLEGDFRAERGLEGFGTRTCTWYWEAWALKTDWKLGGER